MAEKTFVVEEPATSTPEPEAPPMNIIQCIAAISDSAGALAPESKPGVPFPFRGVDGTVNHFAPYLNKYGVVVLPTVLSHDLSSREIGPSKVLKTSKVLVQFTFYAPDMTSVTVTTAGLADDYSDRGAAQAQSVAYRIALLQTFHAPTQMMEPEQSSSIGAGNDTAAAPDTVKADNSVAAQQRAQIGALIKATDNPYDGEMVNALGDELTGKSRAAWMSSASDLKKVVAAINAGQVATAAVAA